MKFHLKIQKAWKNGLESFRGKWERRWNQKNCRTAEMDEVLKKESD
jgi:hypothetical protein